MKGPAMQLDDVVGQERHSRCSRIEKLRKTESFELTDDQIDDEVDVCKFEPVSGRDLRCASKHGVIFNAQQPLAARLPVPVLALHITLPTPWPKRKFRSQPASAIVLPELDTERVPFMRPEEAKHHLVHAWVHTGTGV